MPSPRARRRRHRRGASGARTARRARRRGRPCRIAQPCPEVRARDDEAAEGAQVQRREAACRRTLEIGGDEGRPAHPRQARARAQSRGQPQTPALGFAPAAAVGATTSGKRSWPCVPAPGDDADGRPVDGERDVPTSPGPVPASGKGGAGGLRRRPPAAGREQRAPRRRRESVRARRTPPRRSALPPGCRSGRGARGCYELAERWIGREALAGARTSATWRATGPCSAGGVIHARLDVPRRRARVAEARERSRARVTTGAPPRACAAHANGASARPTCASAPGRAPRALAAFDAGREPASLADAVDAHAALRGSAPRPPIRTRASLARSSGGRARRQRMLPIAVFTVSCWAFSTFDSAV